MMNQIAAQTVMRAVAESARARCIPGFVDSTIGENSCASGLEHASNTLAVNATTSMRN